MSFKSREVKVGKVGVGGANPIRIQSMTTTSTRDGQATAEQIMRLADSGCEIARVTVQGMKEAYACEEIKAILTQKGYSIPLVADIHFYPPAAMTVADFVDKVRINPGNFVDKRATYKTLTYDEGTYGEELAKIEEKFTPLVLKCKKRGIALRIGTNHGSLSDRIMSHFGDTPEGMVESAFEFTRIARAHDFHDIIFSMKASNPLVMIAAYRLLVQRMARLGWDYPLHLGVTEAGAGEDGRVKSAVGIGSLLLDNIGDTIRVSLTEDPACEIEPARRLVNFAKGNTTRLPILETIEKRDVSFPTTLPLNPQGSVLLEGTPDTVSPIPDLFIDPSNLPEKSLRIKSKKEWEGILKTAPEMILFAHKKNRVQEGREFSEWLKLHSISAPVILDFSYSGSFEDLIIEASAECGALLSSGLAEGILLRAAHPASALSQLSFAILQACRMRLSKTEFISCPGCGRTLFNLREVSERIRNKTSHLPGVKIAIMGCIVNGPGEMADADFGYVGSASGKIDLYVGKTCVEKGVTSTIAEEKLIALIKAHGRWTNEK